MSPANRCFHNSLVVQNIIKHVDISEELHLRLINRTCDKEVLRQMRRSFRIVKIEVENENLPKIRINGWLVNHGECFKFLIDKVGVIVEELEVISNGEVDPSAAQVIHDDIFNILIKDNTLEVFKGMCSLCEVSCDQCAKYAIQSNEYGPVQFFALLEFFKESKHFDKLIVDDQLLWMIDSFCRLTNRNQSSRLVIMKQLINSRISCDHLQLQLYDNPTASSEGSLPREILEEMCKTWNVKSLGISFQSQHPSKLNRNVMDQFSSQFLWCAPFSSTPVSTGFLLDFVEVDLEKAHKQFHGVFMKEGSEHTANYNLVANIRKVFPAKHYYFNGNWMSSANDSREMNKFRSVRMLRIAMTGASESNNAPVSIRHWMRPGDQFIDIPIDLNETSLDRASDEITTIAVFVEARVGWCLRAWEEDTGCEFILEVYVDKKNVVASRKSRKSRKRVKSPEVKSPAHPSESIVNVSSESSEAVGHLEIQKPLVKFKMGSFGKALVLTIVTILFVCLFCVGVFLNVHH